MIRTHCLLAIPCFSGLLEACPHLGAAGARWEIHSRAGSWFLQAESPGQSTARAPPVPWQLPSYGGAPASRAAPQKGPRRKTTKTSTIEARGGKKAKSKCSEIRTKSQITKGGVVHWDTFWTKGWKKKRVAEVQNSPARLAYRHTARTKQGRSPH